MSVPDENGAVDILEEVEVGEGVVGSGDSNHLDSSGNIRKNWGMSLSDQEDEENEGL